MATIDEARDLKRRWYNLLQAEPSGFGIQHIGGDGWVLKVNTTHQPPGEVPTEIDGIPLVVEHVGVVIPSSQPEVIQKFGLELTPESFDRLGESLDRITEAERQAWKGPR